MANIRIVSEGTRQPTLPDHVWEKVLPVLQRNIGIGKPFKVKEIAGRLKVSSPSVSAWINDKNRPTYYNLRTLIQVLAEKPGTVPMDLLRQFFGVPQSLVVRDSVSTPRYSNRERAIQLLVEDGVEQAVAEEAANRAAVALDANEDQSVLQWVEMVRPFIKAARRGESGTGLGERELKED